VRVGCCRSPRREGEVLFDLLVTAAEIVQDIGAGQAQRGFREIEVVLAFAREPLGRKERRGLPQDKNRKPAKRGFEEAMTRVLGSRP
jgi:hypothetical protein